ncbi:LacI family DNA-binding transcriptional regulator [Thermoflavimicrobium dichotomicum]|uniref:DNA-binding transcriptional regulator, LacI/PurR family n=1 Tax=Thermoflavimicrobium dichotomicum TaxID=46223 RepID=A0A1I3P056_9BACL|nr:LacI family DNA-binding transcriptional regulator [Thermoflavimicrobium dichotomicum]SFJ14829.1 DNA-binding transcriptional regulator, LacI/PurR family [Thermoflavimicrobium dichotomicum]
MSSVTIKDVARLAGVSPSTVSRVISNHPKISPATKKKVREAMEALGYHPNIMAQSLVSKNTQTLGLVLPHSAEKIFVNPFFSEVLRGMLAYANIKQYDILMSSANNPKEEIEAVTRMVLGRRIDGIILMAPRQKDPIVEKLLEYQFPFVLLGRSMEHDHVLSVNNDNIKAAYDITNHLIKQGHKRIGFVSGPPDLVVSIDRLEGYKKALLEAGLPVHPDWIIGEDVLQGNAFHALTMIMNSPEPPTAFVVTDDVVAFGLIRELYAAGFHVPQDVSIVSFNNIVLSELSNPPITTVDIGIYHLGYLTVQHLIRKLSGEEIEKPQMIVPHRLIIRESSMKLQ